MAIQSRSRGRTVPRAKSAAAGEGIKSPCHQHLAVRQQRRRVSCARGVEAPVLSKVNASTAERTGPDTGRQSPDPYRLSGPARWARLDHSLPERPGNGGQQDRGDRDQSGRDGDLKRRRAGRVISSVFHICFCFGCSFPEIISGRSPKVQYNGIQREVTRKGGNFLKTDERQYAGRNEKS